MNVYVRHTKNLIVWITRRRREDRDRGRGIPEEVREWLRERAERLGVDQALLTWAIEYIDDLMGVSAGQLRAAEDLDDAIADIEVVRPTRRGETLGGDVDLDRRSVRLSENFLWKMRERTLDVLDTPRAHRRLPDLETLVYSHAHAALFHPLMKPDVTVSFSFYRKIKAIGRPGFDIPDEFRRVCERFCALEASGATLPLVPLLHFPARGHGRRIDVESDASSEIGGGLVCLPAPGSEELVYYAFGSWTARVRGAHINVKELYVSLISAFLLGDLFPAFFVLEAIDNTTAAANARTNKASTPEARRILKVRTQRHLDLDWTTHQQYIQSKLNDLADPLSRDRHDEFIRKAQLRGIPEARLRRIHLDPGVHAGLQDLLDLDPDAAPP